VSDRDRKPVPGLKWAGLILGTFAGLFWITSLILNVIHELSEGAQPNTIEGLLLALLVLSASASVGFSWRNLKVGGVLTTGSGLALSIFAFFSSGHNHLIAALVSGFPFLLAGILITFSARWERS
jgi:uncharacterized membrane protein HdeD (DUF308 family)